MILPEGSSTLILVGGIALASYLLLRGSRSRWAKSRKTSADPQDVRKLLPERSRDSALADAPAEVLRWHVELHETARDLKAEIDTKLAGLQALLGLAQEAEQRIEALLSEADRRGFNVGAQHPRDPLEIVSRLADAVDQAAADEALASLPSLSSAQMGMWQLSDAQRKTILRLHEQGYAASDIAQRIALPVGEVEMTLSLAGTRVGKA